MTSRSGPAQRPPRAGMDLSGFPAAVLHPDVWKYRAHTNTHGGAAGVWHFSTGPSGRFNLAEPYGTCYVADSPQAALTELLGPELQDMHGIGRALADTLIVTPVAVAADTTAADLDDARAGRYGVLNELSASAYPAYDIPQAWAAAIHAAGFGGIRYVSRMVAGHDDAAWAIFGSAGPAPTLPHGVARPAERVLRTLGTTIHGDAAARELTVITPPDWVAPSRDS